MKSKIYIVVSFLKANIAGIENIEVFKSLDEAEEFMLSLEDKLRTVRIYEREIT